MKSLILKDLYNIAHNAKSMLFMLVVLAAVFISTSGVEGYVNICTIMCSMMIVTTFSFDDYSGWARYAMITPVSRKDLVAAKFIVLSIFCVVGSLFGLVISSAAGLIMKQVPFDPAAFGELLLLALAAWAISFILGSISIPFVFKFGVEKGRVLLIVSYIVPAGICFGLYQTLVMSGVEITERLVFTLLCCSPIAAVVWCYAMYQISYRIFEKQEL